LAGFIGAKEVCATTGFRILVHVFSPVARNHNMPRISSREYKLMLNAAKFAGDEDQLNAAAGALWRDLAAIIVPSAVAVSGTDDIERKRRQVRFFDTRDTWLRSNDYVVRERVDLEHAERELTLKFRHPDRFISQDRDMTPADGLEADLKFEEDIKPPFQALYSFSSTVLVKEGTALETLKDVSRLYPGLAEAVDEFPKAEPLSVVGGFTAYERVIKGTSFQIRKDPEVCACCSLTLWYDSEAGDTPVVAEFSFKYEDEKEAYTAKMARRAYDAFMDIQARLGDWIDPRSMTKTAYIYAQAGK